MKRKQRNLLMVGGILVIPFMLMIAVSSVWSPTSETAPVAAANPVLSVVAISPKLATLPISISANGNISAWQEASIGNETDGLKLVQVMVNVGDIVKRGQLLATFAADRVRADLAQSQAAVAEAEALLAEASVDVKRTIELQTGGALSGQQIQKYNTSEKTAQARLQAAMANLHTQQLRLEQTQLRAPDDGVISARDATVGAVLPIGQELFRLIRGRRLEWRAEVYAADLLKLKSGQRVDVKPVGGETITGTLRMVAPVVDTQSRNGLAYVDLPLDNTTRAGNFASGHFELGTTEVLTLPQSAVLLRDGLSYVMKLDENTKVMQTKVNTGRRTAELIEITSGITPDDQVVLTGGAFLGNGDLVKIISAPPLTQ